MAVVVVHDKFKYNGQTLPRGTVLTGSEAEALKLKRQFRRYFSVARDEHFEHLPKDAIVLPSSTIAPVEDAAEAASAAAAAPPKAAVPPASSAAVAPPAAEAKN